LYHLLVFLRTGRSTIPTESCRVCSTGMPRTTAPGPRPSPAPSPAPAIASPRWLSCGKSVRARQLPSADRSQPAGLCANREYSTSSLPTLGRLGPASCRRGTVAPSPGVNLTTGTGDGRNVRSITLARQRKPPWGRQGAVEPGKCPRKHNGGGLARAALRGVNAIMFHRKLGGVRTRGNSRQAAGGVRS